MVCPGGRKLKEVKIRQCCSILCLYTHVKAFWGGRHCFPWWGGAYKDLSKLHCNILGSVIVLVTFSISGTSAVGFTPLSIKSFSYVQIFKWKSTILIYINNTFSFLYTCIFLMSFEWTFCTFSLVLECKCMRLKVKVRVCSNNLGKHLSA